MKKTATGTYKTTTYQENEYRQVAGGPKLTVAEKELALDGGIQGTGVSRDSNAYGSDGSNHFTGHLCITGRLGDRDGSFVVAESGVGSPRGATATWQVVPGTASGGLAGLRGGGGWTWEQGKREVAYTLTYEL